MRKNIFITYVIIIAICIAISGLIPLKLTRDNYLNMIEQRLSNDAIMIRDHMLETYDQENLDSFAKDFGNEFNVRVTIVDNKGWVIADSDADIKQLPNHGQRPEIKRALQGELGREIRHSSTFNADMMYVALPLKDNAGAIRLAMSIDYINKSISRQSRGVSIALILALLLALYQANIFSKKVANPISHITNLAKQMTEGNFEGRINIDTDDEVAVLARAFNLMADQLDTHIRKLNDNNIKMQAVLASMTDGIITIDENKNIIIINQAAQKMFDAKDHVEGKGIDFIIEDNDMDDMLDAALYEGRETSKEIVIEGFNKKLYGIKTSPIDQGDGQVGALILIQDITDLRRLEQMRTDFIANVSHELKTPVTSIKGFVETLQHVDIDDKETVEKFLQIIDVEADRLARLIDDILSLSELESKDRSPALETIDIVELVDEIVLIMYTQSQKKNIHINFKCSNPTIWMEGNRDGIKRMIINLMDNAIKYTPAGGKVYISVESIYDSVSICIRDTGIGIPKEHIPRIFERFYRVDKSRSRDMGGTGLGLAIVKHAVNSMSGTIELNSEVGKGTEFLITLPKYSSDKSGKLYS